MFLMQFFCGMAYLHVALMFAGFIRWVFTYREARDPAAEAVLWIGVVPILISIVMIVPISTKALASCIKAKMDASRGSLE